MERFCLQFDSVRRAVTIFMLLSGCSALFAQNPFNSPKTYFAGIDPRFVTSGDMNADGYKDLLVADRSSNSIAVMMNNGEGSFPIPHFYAVGNYPATIAVADFNSDGYPDVAVANHESQNMSVLFNQGDGTLSQPVNIFLGNNPWGVAAGDLDGDGDADLAVSVTVSVTGDDYIAVFLNDGSGNFSVAAYANTSDGPGTIYLRDIDGDKDLDIVVTRNFIFQVYINLGYLTTFLNDGSGHFTFAQDFAIGSSAQNALFFDIDQDSDEDILVCGTIANGYRAQVLENNGTGAYTATYRIETVFPSGLVGGDFDLDGDFDLATTEVGVYSTAIAIVPNNGNNTFASGFTIHVGRHPIGMTAEDLDNDGDLDLAVCISDSAKIAVLVNTTASPTGIARRPQIPKVTQIYNYPNPYNPETTIEYTLDRAANIEINLFTVLGQKIRTIASGYREAGTHSLRFNGSNLSSGIYYYRMKLTSDGKTSFTDMKRMCLVK